MNGEKIEFSKTISIKNEYIFFKRILYGISKRIFDIFFGVIGCLILVPVLVIVKIVYVINGDYESILLIQKRIGQNGQIFNFYKIRTMVSNAEKILLDLLENDKNIAEQYRINKKIKNDPRITKIGKILRKKSIDEFPQFINILKGNMSLIGNRPYLLSEKEDMGIYYNEIIKTKPGLTGIWQVNGRNNTTFQKRLELESKYSNSYSLKKDIKIFFKTVKVLLFTNAQ